MRRLRVRPSQPDLRGPRESLPGPTTWVRPATGWWGRMNAGRKTLRNQGRTVWAPLSVSRRRSRGLRKNAETRRRKARRSASWIGCSLPMKGQAQPQGGHGAAIRTAPVGALPPRMGAHSPRRPGARSPGTVKLTPLNGNRGTRGAPLPSTGQQHRNGGKHFGETNPRTKRTAFWQNEPESSAQHFSALAGMIPLNQQRELKWILD